MAKNFAIVVNSNNDELPFVTGAKSKSISRLINFLMGVVGGARLGAVTVKGRQSLVGASGTLTLSSASGTVGGTINGVSVTVTASGGDTATATALAAAINASANALVSGHVTATSLAGVVTISAVTLGIPGNTITLAASGTGVTASGARLTGGSEDSTITFTF